MSKKFSKDIAAFDYFDCFDYFYFETLIVLSPTSGGTSIISCIVGAPSGIASASFSLIFSLTTGIIKKIIKNSNKQKEKA